MCFTHFPPAAAAAAFIFRAHPDLPLASLCHSTNLPAECIHTCAVRYYCSTVAVRHPPSCCEQVSLDLRQLILELYERHLSPNGRSVSYKKLGSDPLFRRYVDATAELQKVWSWGGLGFWCSGGASTPRPSCSRSGPHKMVATGALSARQSNHSLARRPTLCSFHLGLGVHPVDISLISSPNLPFPPGQLTSPLSRRPTLSFPPGQVDIS